MLESVGPADTNNDYPTFAGEDSGANGRREPTKYGFLVLALHKRHRRLRISSNASILSISPTARSAVMVTTLSPAGPARSLLGSTMMSRLGSTKLIISL